MAAIIDPHDEPTIRRRTTNANSAFHGAIPGGIGWLAVADLQRLGHGGLCLHRRLVRGARQARVESARMALRAGLDGPLCLDGRGGLAGLASGRLGKAKNRVGPVYSPMGLECPVDSAVLRAAQAGLGAGGDRDPAGGPAGDVAGLLAGGSPGWPDVGALCRLGGFRHGLEWGHLVAELIAATAIVF